MTLARARRLRPADALEAAALIRCAFARQALATDPPSAALQETPDSVAAAIASGGGAGVEAEGALAGVVLWALLEDHLYLRRLAVAPAHRRRGIARALIAEAEREARRRGLPCVRLGVRLALADNRRLFAACRYREGALGTHPGYPAPTSVTMEKRLLSDAADQTGSPTERRPSPRRGEHPDRDFDPD